jgi:hypothetical protein
VTDSVLFSVDFDFALPFALVTVFFGLALAGAALPGSCALRALVFALGIGVLELLSLRFFGGGYADMGSG